MRQSFGNVLVRLALPLAIGAWAVAIGVGYLALVEYSATPSDAAQPPAEWPHASALPHDPARHTLIVFLHPQCGCSRATVGELARLDTRLTGQIAVHVVLVKPPDTAAGWEQTDLATRAAAIPHATVWTDEGGREAAIFGAKTSGQAFLFSPAKHLQFSGGLTHARGHAGDSIGQAAIVEWVTTGTSACTTADVFGCLLSADSLAARHQWASTLERLEFAPATAH